MIVVASGINGVQFSTLIKNTPATITKIMAETFRITMALFAFAAPFVPLTKIEITNNTITNAGRFKNNLILKSSGAALKFAIVSWKVCNLSNGNPPVAICEVASPKAFLAVPGSVVIQ